MWLRTFGRIPFSAVMAAVAFVLSLGSSLYVDQHDTGVPLPFSVLSHLPVFDGIVATRFSLFTNLFVALILAIGLDQLFGRLRNADHHALFGTVPVEWKPVFAGVICLVIAAVVAVTLWPSRAQPSSSTSAASFITSGAAKSIPAGSVVLAYPYPNTPVHTLNGKSVIFYPFVESIDDVLLGQAVSDFPFKLIGSYGWVPGAGERNPNPTPLRPASVEDLFNAAFYGREAVQSPSLLKERLRAFIRKYDVTAVIVLPLGRHPDAVVRAVSAAIGPPSSSDKTDIRLHV